MPEDSRVIQVTNVAPGATRDQMKTLFSYVGKIDDVQLYPADETIELATSKICYVKFYDSSDVNVSLHLTNTVFIDRALIVSPLPDGHIPDEATALAMISAPGFTGVTHPSKADELARTVYVGNLSGTATPDAIMAFISQAGEVKYVRMAGDEGSLTRGAFVEFTERSSVLNALAMTGMEFSARPVHVQQSLNTIIKPAIAGVVASSREVEEAMRKVNDAQSLISAAVDPDLNGDDRSRSKSKSKRSRSHRSRSKKRSRSRSHHSRKRSHSRSHRSSRRRSRSRSPRRRSPSPRGGSRHGRRSRSRDHKSKRRTRSPSPKRPTRSHRSRSGSKRKRSPPRDGKSSRKSRSRSAPKVDKESSQSDRDRKDGDRKDSGRKESSRKKSRSTSKSPKASSSSSSRRDKEKTSSGGGGGGSRRDRSKERDKETSSSSSKRTSEREKEREKERERESERGGRRGGDRGSDEKDRDRGGREGREKDNGREKGEKSSRDGGRERDRGEPKSSRDSKSNRRSEREDPVEEREPDRSNVSRRTASHDYEEEEQQSFRDAGFGRDRNGGSDGGSECEAGERKQGGSVGRYSSKSGDDHSPPRGRGDINFTQMDMDVDSDD